MGQPNRDCPPQVSVLLDFKPELALKPCCQRIAGDFLRSGVFINGCSKCMPEFFRGWLFQARFTCQCCQAYQAFFDYVFLFDLYTEQLLGCHRDFPAPFLRRFRPGNSGACSDAEQVRVLAAFPEFSDKHGDISTLSASVGV